MKGVSYRGFGLIIAYLIPGFLFVWGMKPFSGTVSFWLERHEGREPTVGGFLYITVAAVGAGLAVSAVRWLLLDRLHHLTGVKEPGLDFSAFEQGIQAFDSLVENHYRHYQFYGNTLVSLVFAYWSWRTAGEGMLSSFGVRDWGVYFIGAVFLVASRDTLRKYYSRASQVLSAREGLRKETDMVNGYGHEEEGQREKPRGKKVKPGKGKPQGREKSRRKKETASAG